MEKVLRSGTIALILLIPSVIAFGIFDPITVSAGETQYPVFLGIDKDLDRYYKDPHMNITMRTSIPFNESQEMVFYYEISTKGLSGITDEWIEIQDPLKNKDTTDLKVECIFKTGDQNFLRFTAFNSSGVRHDSDVYRIMIDDRGPQITLHSPNEDKWLITTTPEITFYLEDTMTGVDPTSLYYRISTNGSDEWSEWTPYLDFEEGSFSMEMKIRVEFERGDGNHLEIKGCDVAGNSLIYNRIFEFKVNTMPVINIISPRKGDILWDDMEIVFDASSSYDPDGDRLEYKWQYSNGDSISILGEVCRYVTRLSYGDYTISLTITDRPGHTVQESFRIKVRQSYPAPRFPDLDNETDKDHDGMSDNWELKYWLKRWLNDSQEDPDGDGFTNLQEYQNDTNPWDPNDHPPLIIKEAPPPEFMSGNWLEQYWTILMIGSQLFVLAVFTTILAIKKYRKRSRPGP